MQNHVSPRHRQKTRNGTHTGPTKPEPLQLETSEWDSVLPVPKLSFKSAAFIVGLLSVVCFCNSIYGDFVFDDTEAILTNDDLKPETPWTDIFQNDFWGKKLTKKESHKSYRPLTILTFRWNYWLSGGYHPMSFHFTNVILHTVVCILFMHMFSVLFGGIQPSSSEGKTVFAAPRASLVCAVLFAIHPIHTESVAGVVGRADLLCALLFYLSFTLYIRACHADISCHGRRPSYFSVILVLLSVVCCATAMLFKELGITAIGVCSAYDIIIICRIDPMEVLSPKTKSRHETSSNDNSRWISSLVLRQLILVVSATIMLVYRWYIMGSGAPSFQPVDNPASFAENIITRTINYNYIYALNCWLLINPWWLCFDWAMGCVPLIETITDPRILAVLVFWVILGSLLWYGATSKECHEKRLLIMSLALLVIPFLPAANLFFRVGFVIAERQLYLPSLGYSMLVTIGLCKLCRKRKQSQQVLKIILIVFIVLNVWRCVIRSHEWTKEELLYKAGAKVCPLNAKVHYNIAKNTADRGNVEEAILEYREAVRLHPEYDQAMNNLANILKDRNQEKEAEKLLNRAVRIRPEFAAAWMNLGIVQASLKKYQLAEISYHNALTHRRKYPDCYFNLGNLYLDQGFHGAALQAWYNATQLKTDHKLSWSNIIALLDNTGQFDEAIGAALKALQYIPDDDGLYFGMANVYGKAGKYAEAEKYYLKALTQKPNSANYHGNLGVLYHRWEKYNKAEMSYKKSLELDPDSPTMKDNINKLYRKMAKMKPAGGSKVKPDVGSKVKSSSVPNKN
ncbi:protein O-mannosyl-transferase TMTC4-like [Glandiceps talaboti]